MTAHHPLRAQGLSFVPISPCRVIETRWPNGPLGGPALAGGSTRDFPISSGNCNIPVSAQAYSLNITVIPNQTFSYLKAWPTGQPMPGEATILSASDGRMKANAAIIAAGANGSISLYASNDTHVSVDVNGYFTPDPSQASFYPVAPCRVADTRNSAGALGGPYMAGGSIRTFPVLAGGCGLPGNAAAYVLNVTAVPHGSLNYITMWAAGQPQPGTSTLNAPTGTVTANTAIVGAGAGGQISVYTSDDTDLILDVAGYFAQGSGGLSFYPLSPCRALDTRTNGGAPIYGQMVFNLAQSSCGVPATAGAYLLNTDVIPSGSLAYLQLWDDAAAQPATSVLNAPDGAVTSNLSVTSNSNGPIDVYASDPTHVILDIFGYFASWPTITAAQNSSQKFEIVNVQSGKVLDVDAGTISSNGAKVQQWDWAWGDNQRWQFASVGAHYKIVNVQSGKVLDLPIYQTANGVQLQQWDWAGGTNQMWDFVPVSGNPQYYEIVNVQSGKVLDLPIYQTANGVQLQQWDWAGGTNQMWHLAIAPDGDGSSSSTPDPSPAPYPNYLATPPSPPAGSCNITGNWADGATYGSSWSLTQTGNNVSGIYTAFISPGCGNITWQVTGTSASNSATLTAANPSVSYDGCGNPTSTRIFANVVFPSCTTGTAQETSIIPAWKNQFGQSGPGGTYNAAGPWQLASGALKFSLSSPSQVPIPGDANNAQMLPMSTGDSLQIITTASLNSYPLDVVYSSSFQNDPNSTCSNDAKHALLSINEGQGTGSATSNISASPSGCSGIFSVYGNVGGTTTQNVIDVVVPPQLLIQMLYGEAHGQAVSGDTVSELAIGAVVRNQFGDNVYFKGVNTYQDAIVAKQFDSIKNCQAANNCVQTGTIPELNNAALIYAGIPMSAMNVAKAKCFFSPDADGWRNIQAALNNPKTTVVPYAKYDPGCFSRPFKANEQFVYKTSIGANANGSGAPAFILVQWKNLTDPAAIQIP